MCGEFRTTSATHVGVARLDKRSFYNTGIPVFWGLIIALISLPFYLLMVIPQIGKTAGMDSFGTFMVPLFASFLVAVVLCDRGFVNSLIALVVGAVALISLIIFVFVFPSLIGLVWFIDYYYVSMGTKIIVSIVILFPSLLIGGVTGRVFGEMFISEQTKKEKRELNQKMREWKETLEKVLEEKLEEEMRQKEKRESSWEKSVIDTESTEDKGARFS